ncbi:MAG: POTRA domain-containing protein, partial [Acidobacteriota bacterium]
MRIRSLFKIGLPVLLITCMMQIAFHSQTPPPSGPPVSSKTGQTQAPPPKTEKAPGESKAPTIEKIILEGNQRLTRDAFMALTSIRPGDVYDPQQIIKEYNKIWKSGLFDDLSVDVKDGKTGKILIWHIKERPIIATVEFKGSKKLTSSTVLDELKKNDAEIKTGTVLDYDKIKRTESALRYMAAEKGFPDAEITSEIHNLGPSQVSVIFHVKQGPKARIDKVKFLGVHAFSHIRLKYTLKKTRPHWFLSWITRHDIYSEGRYQEDIKNLRDLYESHGYLDVDIGDPIIDSHFNRKHTKKWLTLSIPIHEGVSYNLGKVDFSGNHLFTDKELAKGLKMFRLKKGKTLNRVALTGFTKWIEAKYGEKGYIYATATPIFDKHPKEKVANVTISITEDQKYYVNRIEFFGNTQTRDYVLRREMGVEERQVFNMRRYQRGLYKLQQPG